MCIIMSDVRLSNASPTLERVDARQLDSGRPSVRRNLFGSPDRAELREIFQATMQANEQGFRCTYNFDPVEHRPLSPGMFEWEEWKDAPEFYRRPPHQRPYGKNNNRPSTAETERARKRAAELTGSSCSTEPQTKSSRCTGDEERDREESTGTEERTSAENRTSPEAQSNSPGDRTSPEERTLPEARGSEQSSSPQQ